MLRLEGLEDIPSVLPTAPAGRGLTATQRGRRAVGRALASSGHVEVLTSPFVDPSVFDAMGVDHDDERRSTMSVVNPLESDKAHLATTLLPSLMEIARRNLTRGTRTGSATKARRDGLRGRVHRRGTPLAGLVLGQGAVVRAEGQRVGERLAPLTELAAGVDVEEADTLEELAAAGDQRGLDGRGGHGVVHDHGDVLVHGRVRGDRGGGQYLARAHGGEIELDRAGPRGHPQTLAGGGVQLAGVADHGAVDHDLDAAAGVPRSEGRGAHLGPDPEGGTDDYRCFLLDPDLPEDAWLSLSLIHI